ncbi:MAG TPA: phosphatase PAP2 family protein [Gaiellaceae bacterium]|nr:phosphatase PAP2 family protein [Gaiellaceae bacterium]
MGTVETRGVRLDRESSPSLPRARERFVARLDLLPGGRRSAAALAVAFLAAVAFARVAEDYLTNDPLARWDVSFARWLSEHREPALDELFRAVTFVGSPGFALGVAAVAALLLYRGRRIAEAALLVVVLGCTELVNVVLKLVFHRPRPEVGFVHLDTYSFPSGHAMISTAAYGVLTVLVLARLRSGRGRALLVGGSVALVAAICFSRLYLGVHYLSDVLGGIAGGAACLALALAVYWAAGPRFAAWFAQTRLDRIGRALTRVP